MNLTSLILIMLTLAFSSAGMYAIFSGFVILHLKVLTIVCVIQVADEHRLSLINLKVMF